MNAGLARMDHTRLVTPRSRNLFAGIVSLDIAGLAAEQAVALT